MMADKDSHMARDFRKTFKALTGHEPFPWQQRLYEEFCSGKIPQVCDIPTGLGKTAVIVIWLIALTTRGKAASMPRRLVYVVNRRTIVDQSTDVVMQIQNKLEHPGADAGLKKTADSLRVMAAGTTNGELLAVSTLRGELADKGEWRKDPTRPAIIIGTVDMIGSKLLFSGYGDSRYWRPLHAGLLGCDTLFVHDEAHLTPAFGKTLRSICRSFQTHRQDDANASRIPPTRLLELSATLIHENEEPVGTPVQLDEDDEKDTIVKQRIDARKQLRLNEVAKAGRIVQEKITELALAHAEDRQRVIVFVQSPDAASGIAKSLKKELTGPGDKRVSLLTGQIRGHERDQLLNREAMLPFSNEGEPPEKTVYLVATSAGEVGMDLHADQMVSDLTSLDSMIQRLGRVNRFGTTDARVDVVYEQPLCDEPTKLYELARHKTLSLLHEVQDKEGYIDVCTRALRRWRDCEEAFSPRPPTVELSDILFDGWSQTSIGKSIPARPEPAAWLHGVQDDLPEAWLAWRKEVSILAKYEVGDEDVARWFQRHPVHSREQLRMPTYQLKKALEKNSKWIKTQVERDREKDEQGRSDSVIVLLASGEARRTTLDKLVEGKQDFSLDFATIILPTEAGGLTPDGVFDPSVKEAAEKLDVSSDELFVHELHVAEDQRLTDAIREAHEKATEKQGMLRRKYLLLLKADEAGEDNEEEVRRYLLLSRKVEDGLPGKGSNDMPSVTEHCSDVAQHARAMAESFGLCESLQEAFEIAGKYHDIGKEEDRWQIAAGHDPKVPNYDPKAKPPPGGSVNWRMLDGYRHECGSLMKAVEIDEIMSHDQRDLILHLIATHHGWARPHFAEQAFGPFAYDPNAKLIAREAMLRYTRLQERFGYWRLAWLESLLRCADGIASQQYDDLEAGEEN